MVKVANPKFRERIREFLTRQYFMHHIKFDLSEIEPGQTSGVLELQNIHKQQFGRVHGGVIATLADITAGFAAYTVVGENDHVVTGEIKVSYFSSAKGNKLMSVGTVLKPGRKVNFCEAEVYDLREDGSRVLIAKASTSMITIPETQTKS